MKRQPDLARAAFTKLGDVANVRAAAELVPGLEGVIVHAAATADWERIRSAVRGNGFVVLGHFDLADLAANFAALTAEERAEPLLRMPGHADAWQQLATGDPRLAGGRVLAGAFARLSAGRAAAWDPRLDDVGEVLAAQSEYWRTVLPATPAGVAAGAAVVAPVGAGNLAAQIERIRAPLTDPLAAQPIVAARASLPTAQVERLAVAQCLAAERMQRLCADVAEHTDRLAGRARDAARAAALRRLAAECRELAAAAQIAARYTRW